MTQIQCPQEKCAFHSTRRIAAFCPVCKECGATSNTIERDNCVNCWNCWKDEGFVRDGEPDMDSYLNRKKKKIEVMA